MDTSSFILSSNGANDFSSNNITSDNISVLTSLSVAGNNILSSLSTLNTNINNINSFAGSTASSLNITASSQINFNVGTTLTNINASGLNVFSNGRQIFPFSYAGWYNVAERLDNLVLVMQDTPIPIIAYGVDNNTVIRIRQDDTLNNYPKQIQFCDFLNKKVGYFNTSGLNLLDVNGNYNNISSYFAQTGNSLLLCSNKTMIDAGGNLNVFEMTTYSILGIPTGTGGTWLNVADTLNSNTSNITTLSNSYNTVLSQLSTISGNVANIANIANYYSGLQSSLAVTNGVVSGSGLVLAFNLKEDRYDAQYPLYKRAPVPLSGESFNQLSLKYNGALAMDSSNNLTINTSGFLTPTYGDLGLLATPNGISSASTSYVVVGRLSQPITCVSSLNVSGTTTLSNNATFLSSLNVSGNLTCSNINSPTINNINTNISALQTTQTSILNNLNSSLTVSGTSQFNNNVTLLSKLNVSGTSQFNNTVNVSSGLNVSGAFTCNVLSAFNSTIPSILFTTSSTTINTPNTTIPSVLMVSGNTSFNSAVNITGRTIIGNDIYNFSDSVLEVYKNFSIRKNITNLGDRIELKVGLGTTASTITMEETYDINMWNNIGNISLNCSNTTSNTAINLNASQVNVSNNLLVTGSLKCLNLGQRTPLYFTTSRTINLNGTNFSCYDIDLRTYTNSMLLDGYNIRQFRIRTWLSDADFQHPNMYINNYDVFMSDRGGLSIFAHGGPLWNLYFDQSNASFNQFLYRNSFNIVTYCSRQGSKKVYCIIEDLL